MNRPEVIEIILQELTKSEYVSYVSSGCPIVAMSQTLISLDFTAISNDYNGSVTFYSPQYEPLMLKAQYDNSSTLIDNERAKKRINEDINRINDLVNKLN